MADKTALFESSQALLCAVADYLGVPRVNVLFDINKYKNFSSFKSALLKTDKKALIEAAKRTETPGVKPKDIEKFLDEDEEWYISTVKVAKKLVNDLKSIDPDYKIRQKGFNKIFYFRGDQKVMGNIEKLYKIANQSVYTSQVKFGNVNKWCPADMYLAADKAVKIIEQTLKNAKPKVYSFTNLNVLISDLIDRGDLLPLSLKKVTKTEPILKKVNFDRKKEIEFIKEIKIKSLSDWQPYKKVKYGTKGSTRDMQLFLITGGFIKLRHDPSAKRFVAEAIFDKAEARGGSIGSIQVFCQMLGYIDKGLADKILLKFRVGEQKYYKALQPLEKFRAKDKQRFDFERGQISALYVINEIMPLLKTFFSKKDNKANGFIQLMFEYITSRTPLSGRFVIAK